MVLIIGESTQRNYMSLYGYPLKTTPNLDALAESKDLFVFSDVISPHSHTDPSLAKALTFSNYENTQTKWFYKQNIIDIMKIAGYKTFWISNQEAISIYGNAPQAIASRADEKKYTSIMDSYSTFNLDGQILPLLHTLKAKQSQSKQDNNFSFYVLHLMGTHSGYANRYPSSFSAFSPQTLSKHSLDTMANGTLLTSKQAKTKSTYINAILYNDYIVSEIIKSFKDDEAIIFYFSDHGDEVYDFRDFAGHSESMVSRYMLEIPFMIYITPKLRQTQPKLLQQIKTAQNLPFMNDDFIHSFLDILGINTLDSDKERSIFSKEFNAKRARLIGGYDYDRELHQESLFEAPDKIWLHRCDEPKKFEDFKDKFANVEIDVHFLNDGKGEGRFDVGHDGAQKSIGLRLEDMLKIITARDMQNLHLQDFNGGGGNNIDSIKTKNRAKIWLDFKNLDSSNAKSALSILKNLCKTYNIPHQNIIIESSNHEQLGAFKQSGFYTSYYVPYYAKNDLSNNATQIRKHIQNIIDSDNVNAISFAYYLYDFIKAQKFMKNGKDFPLLTWNEGADIRSNMQTNAFYDPQVKVILAGVKGKYR